MPTASRNVRLSIVVFATALLTSLTLLSPQLLTAAPNFAVTNLPDGSIKLTASNGGTQHRFGRSVAITGVSAIVGAEFADEISPNSGAAYVYTATINAISETQILTGNDTATDDSFGTSVASDVNTAIVGAPGHDNFQSLNSVENGGAAYIFVRDSNNNWAQQAKLLPNDPQVRGAFGSAVAIDGNIAVVGNPGPFDDPGAVYVFERTNNTDWVQRQKIVPAGLDILDGFAAIIAIDGDTILLGSPRDDERMTGAVYVYTRSGNTWSQTQKLFPADAATNRFSNFGADVAIEGNTAIMGAWGDDTQETNGGSAYIFTRSGNTWSQAQKIQANDTMFGGNFGITVGLSGNIALVASTDGTGAVYVFNRSGNTWVQTRKLTPADTNTFNAFGTSIAFRNGVGVFGATADPDANTFRGAAYVFFLNDASASDVNNDGIVTAADAVFVINRVGTISTAADVNNDGMVDAADVQLVLSNIGITITP